MSKKTPQPDPHRREAIVNEILSSEQSYMEQLLVVRDVYMEGSRGVLPADVHSSVFNNITSIIELNSQFLRSLEERLHNYRPSLTLLGTLFNEYIPFFALYSQYVNNHEDIGPLLHDMRTARRFASFREFQQLCRQNPRTKREKLESLLIAPIQRIPRYKLLLAQLVKYTDPSHADYDNLVEALHGVKRIAMRINEHVRASENRRLVREIQDKFDGVTFIAPHRRFIVSGTLVKTANKGAPTPYKFFLFNDVLVWAVHRRSGDRYEMTNSLPIDEHFFVEKVPTVLQANTIKIIYDQQSFYLSAQSSKDRKSWYRALCKCIKERDQTIAGSKAERKRASLVLAPVHQSKKVGTDCKVCAKRFGLLRRKKTCKACGEVVCNSCSKARLMVHSLDKKVRVCSLCVEKVMARNLEEQQAEQGSAFAFGDNLKPPDNADNDTSENSHSEPDLPDMVIGDLDMEESEREAQRRRRMSHLLTVDISDYNLPSDRSASPSPLFSDGDMDSDPERRLLADLQNARVRAGASKRTSWANAYQAPSVAQQLSSSDDELPSDDDVDGQVKAVIKASQHHEALMEAMQQLDDDSMDELAEEGRLRAAELARFNHLERPRAGGASNDEVPGQAIQGDVPLFGETAEIAEPEGDGDFVPGATYSSDELSYLTDDEYEYSP